MRPNLLCLALWLALPTVAAAETAAVTAATDLDRIVVTATRTERAADDVPNTVDVIDRQRMDDALIRDLKDLVRYEPGINIGSSYGRFGLGDIRIRGLGGNRVRIQTDQIPVSDAFAIGSFANANRNFVDLGTLKRVEIVRGPGSALYGSDALAGVVAFATRDPVDYLQDDAPRYLGLRLGYEGDWQGLFAGATAAFGGERWSGLVVANHRQGQETENQGENDVEGSLRTTPNPQQRDGRSVLAKLVYAPSGHQQFKLTVEGNEDRTETDVLSARGFQPLTRATTDSLLGDDRQTRARVALAHELDLDGARWADALDWQVYRQDSETTQATVELRRTASGVPQRRERAFNFDQRVQGVQANLHKAFAGGGAEHVLSYGLDLARTDTRQKRDGRATTLTTGATSNVVAPDTFPVRDFPVSRTTNAALYLQDEISLANGAWRLVPGVRVDHYALRPEVDAIFAGDNPGVAVEDLTHTSVSPKLGAVWHFTADWSLFAGYAHGFRAPPYNDVNIGFTNLQFGYTAIANPDLRPETSDGFEAGLRFSGEAVHAGLSVYDNRYHDFIESLRFIGVNAQGLSVFQSQNVAEARIYGIELKADVDLAAWSTPWQGWSLRGAGAWSRGEDRSADRPLDSIDAPSATLGLAYATEAWGKTEWGVELAGRFSTRKRAGSDPTLYRTPGYGVLDLFAHWSFAPGARVTAGVFNLGDRKYFAAGDVPLVDGGSQVLDRYTSPGRSLAMSFSVGW